MATRSSNGNGSKSGTRTREALERQVGTLAKRLQESDSTRMLENESYREAILELELALEDVGWQRMGWETDQEFSRAGLDKIVTMARLAFLKNPLIRRGIMVQSYYVFGQGVNIQASDPTVNEVVQRFLESPKNRAMVSGHAAREANEQALQHDGNLFFAFFTNPTTGEVVVRIIPIEEMREIVDNPEDRSEPWYYKRVWWETEFDLASGTLGAPMEKTAYYPDWRIFHTGPTDDTGKAVGKHPTSIGGFPVELIPIYHLKVGGLRHSRWGLPDVYAALDWARAYKNFLENWSSIVDSLSRFAWKLTTKGSRIPAARAKLQSSAGIEDGQLDSNPAPTTGAIFIGDEQSKLDPIPKTGATVSADDGKALRLMVASAMDIPDTILSGDPDQGNLATAKTLDRPTELAMRSRQMVWQEAFKDFTSMLIDADLRAPQGLLPKVRDSTAANGVVLGNDEAGQQIDREVSINFPSILEDDRESVIKSIVSAATLDGKPLTDLLPRDLIVRMLLVAFEEENIDSLLDDMFPDDGTGPTGAPASQGPPQQATERMHMVNAFRDLQTAVRSLTAPRTVMLTEAGAADAVANRSVMVGFFLTPADAALLAIPGGEPADQLHITLGFLGTEDEVGADRIAALTEVVSRFAAYTRPVSASTAGVGRFELGTDADPVWAAIDAPGLDVVRVNLVRELAWEGFAVHQDHGFQPHCTLAFAAPGQPSPVESVPEVSFLIDTLTVAVGGVRYDYAMAETTFTGAK